MKFDNFSTKCSIEKLLIPVFKKKFSQTATQLQDENLKVKFYVKIFRKISFRFRNRIRRRVRKKTKKSDPGPRKIITDPQH
jgi:hypothetical protein